MNDEVKALLDRYQPKQVHVLQPELQVLSVRFSPCGRFLVAGDYDARLRRWDMSGDEPQELPTLEGHGGWLTTLGFSPDGKRLFSADSWGRLRGWTFGEQPEIAWDIEAAHNGWLRDLAVSPDGAQVATCGCDGTVRLWAAVDGKPLRQFADYGEDLYRVCFHPDGRSLFSGDSKGIVKQWDAANGEHLRDFDAGVLHQMHRIQDVGGVRSLAVDPAGKLLACGGAQPATGGFVTGVTTLLLFDIESGELKQKLEPGTNNDVYLCELAFHPDGFLMGVTSGQPGNGKLLFFRPGDSEPFIAETKLPNCHSLSLHPGTRRLAVTATNRGSNGNGRRVDDKGEYACNTTPIHLFELPAPAE